MGHPAFWLLGLGVEILYLLLLSTNPRFHNVVIALDKVGERQSESRQSQALMQQLDPEEKRQVLGISEKCRRILRAYQDLRSEQFLIDANVEALEKLQEIYLKLMISRHYLRQHQEEADEESLRKQIHKIKNELAESTSSSSLRDSREATLHILSQRLANIGKRSEAMEEMESDLTRIEAQIDLALENATMSGKTEVISGKIDLVSRLLDDAIYEDSEAMARVVHDTYPSGGAVKEPG
ncbi:MAG: hypothetical protein HC904_02795 [Blastochloris sp.]|nr:hypothetical protein [Blastochloris sp.]